VHQLLFVGSVPNNGAGVVAVHGEFASEIVGRAAVEQVTVAAFLCAFSKTTTGRRSMATRPINTVNRVHFVLASNGTRRQGDPFVESAVAS